VFNAVLTACEDGQQWRRAVQVCEMMTRSGIPRNKVDVMVRMLMPTLGPLAPAARAAFSSGKAARRWIDSKPKAMLSPALPGESITFTSSQKQSTAPADRRTQPPLSPEDS
jgi:pentatricopeptide repeat protein